MGYRIDSKGIHADPAKLAAITEAPRPSNQQQLKSFLGLIQYYGKFIPNLSALLNPLHNLLKAKTKWKWSAECNRAFKEAKERLSSALILAHYNPALPLRLARDA